MLVLRICNHTSTYIQWSHMLPTKPCASQISKLYDLVRAACGLFNLLKVDMFMNPTNIEPARAATGRHRYVPPLYSWWWGVGWVPWDSTDESLFYTPECGVSNELLLGKIVRCDAFYFYYVFLSFFLSFGPTSVSPYQAHYWVVVFQTQNIGYRGNMLCTYIVLD